MTDHDGAGLYFKPESGVLMASPMDQDPSPPCDARPTEEAVAAVADKLARMAPPLTPRAIRHKWAGLRTFSPDRVPVVGADPRLPGFFWLAGQGGVGIETSPALGAIAADLLVDGRTERFDAALLAPIRFCPKRF
jgi:D-arginine dehydrogenase